VKVMNEVTIQNTLETKCYNNILSLKLELIRHKKMGTIFASENISELAFDKPFEFYFMLQKENLIKARSLYQKNVTSCG
jgi:hypothetical protein